MSEDLYPDADGMRFWESIAGTAEDAKVPVLTFSRALCTDAGAPFPGLRFEDVDRVLRYVVKAIPPAVAGHRSSGGAVVVRREWELFLHRFGPFHLSLTKAIDGIFPPSTGAPPGCLAPWFHGNVSRSSAEILLRDAGPGEFLVRFSENFPKLFTLVYLKSTGSDGGTRNKHCLLYNLGERGYALKKASSLTERDSVYPSIAAVVSGNQRILSRPCSSALYHACLTELIEGAGRMGSDVGATAESRTPASPSGYDPADELGNEQPGDSVAGAVEFNSPYGPALAVDLRTGSSSTTASSAGGGYDPVSSAELRSAPAGAPAPAYGAVSVDGLQHGGASGAGHPYGAVDLGSFQGAATGAYGAAEVGSLTTASRTDTGSYAAASFSEVGTPVQHVAATTGGAGGYGAVVAAGSLPVHSASIGAYGAVGADGLTQAVGVPPAREVVSVGAYGAVGVDGLAHDPASSPAGMRMGPSIAAPTSSHYPAGGASAASGTRAASIGAYGAVDVAAFAGAASSTTPTAHVSAPRVDAYGAVPAFGLQSAAGVSAGVQSAAYGAIASESVRVAAAASAERRRVPSAAGIHSHGAYDAADAASLSAPAGSVASQWAATAAYGAMPAATALEPEKRGSATVEPDLYEVAAADTISSAPHEINQASSREVSSKLQAGIKAFRDRDHAAAARLFEETVALARSAGEPLSEARALANLASVYKKQDRVGESVELYRAALTSLRRVGDIHMISSVLKSLADCLESLGRYDEARAACEDRAQYVSGADATDLQRRIATVRRLSETR